MANLYQEVYAYVADGAAMSAAGSKPLYQVYNKLTVRDVVAVAETPSADIYYLYCNQLTHPIAHFDNDAGFCRLNYVYMGTFSGGVQFFLRLNNGSSEAAAAGDVSVHCTFEVTQN